MQFRGLLMGGSIEKLDAWLHDTQLSGIYAMLRFARAARQDIDAVRNAVLEPWSNGQTEGQINRLKAIKRAMYGRAGIELLRARMIPLIKSICTKSETEPQAVLTFGSSSNCRRTALVCFSPPRTSGP